MASHVTDILASYESKSMYPLSLLLISENGVDCSKFLTDLFQTNVFPQTRQGRFQIAEKQLKCMHGKYSVTQASSFQNVNDVIQLRNRLLKSRPIDIVLFFHTSADQISFSEADVFDTVNNILGTTVWLNTVFVSNSLTDSLTFFDRLNSSIGYACPLVTFASSSSTDESFKALGGEISRILSSGKKYFPSPLPKESNTSESVELNELSMLMDSNLNRLPTSKYEIFSQGSHNNSVSETENAEESHSSAKMITESTFQPSVTPLLATASLSLSLNAALNSKLFLNKVTLTPHSVSASPTLNNPASVSAVSVAPMKKKQVQNHSPLPVMSSFQSQTQLDYSGLSSQPLKNLPKSASAFPDVLRLPSKGHSFSNPASCPAARKAAIVWFRSDLRIHDNEALVAANNDSLSILPVYCFDPRDYGKSSSGFDKTGPYRAKFLLECVNDLRENLRKKGSDLIVRIGKPEEVLVKLAKAIGADALYAHQEVTYEELHSENKVSASLKEEGIESKLFWGSTLYHLDDLPFSLGTMPSNYGGFRESVKSIKIRSTSQTPSQLKNLPVRGNVKAGEIPTLQQLGLSLSSSPKQDEFSTADIVDKKLRRGEGEGEGEREGNWSLKIALCLFGKKKDKKTDQCDDGGNVAASALEGGETEALKRLERFVIEARNQSSNAKNGNGNGDSLYGANFSCKISPWLAMGCLSPRKMYEDLSSGSKISASASVVSDAAPQASNDLNWLVFELLWRDFFRFITKKYGSGRKAANSPAPAMAVV